MLDTSAVIGWSERNDAGVRAAVQAANEIPNISVITLGELHAGVAHAVKADDQLRVDVRTRTLTLAQSLGVSYITPEVTECFGALSAELTRRIAANDRWIAATAIVNGAALVTQDASLLKLNELTLRWAALEVIYCGQ